MTLDELKKAEHLSKCRRLAMDAARNLMGTSITPYALSWSGSDRTSAFLPADIKLRDMLVDTLKTYALSIAGDLSDLGVFTNEGSSPDSENGRKDENNDPGR